MAAISAFGVTQHSQIFSLFFRNRIQCIALYQLHNSQALLNLRRGYYSTLFAWHVVLCATKRNKHNKNETKQIRISSSNFVFYATKAQ